MSVGDLVVFSRGDDGKFNAAAGNERAEFDNVKLTGRSPQSFVVLRGDNTSFV